MENDIIQVNIRLKKSWKEKLSSLAREIAYKDNKDYSLQDLIRDTLKEKYNLED